MKQLQIVFCLFLISQMALSQNSQKEDSLLTSFTKATNNKGKANSLNSLSLEISARDPEKALSYAQQALGFANREGDKRIVASSYFNIGNSYDYLFTLDSAILYYEKYLKIGIEIHDSTIISHGHNLVGSVYIYLGDYTKALEKCLLSLRIAESRNDKKNAGKAANNIGNVFYFQNKKEMALSYWKKALDINLELNDKRNAAAILSNIGAYYNDIDDYVNALKYLDRALKMQKELGNLGGVALTLTNIGLASYDQRKYKEALTSFYEALSISKKLNDDFGKISEYNNIGFCYYNMKKYNEAINAFLTADSICIKHDSPDGRRSSLKGLSDAFEMTADFKSAYKYHKLLAEVSDSLLNSESTKQVAELETKYKTEKKEQENKLLSAQNKISETEISKQKSFTVFFIIAIVLVSLLALYIFRSYKIKNSANLKLSIKNDQIQKQKLEVEHQKHLIDEKHKEITDSINYAERIQRSFLATKELLNENLADYFVFFQPKDVVSGDFYWAGKLKNGNFALATADSTGHGVPGAIMSILNISCIEKAVEERELTEPGEILNHTRKKIIERLKKDGSKSGGKDGMDCSFISFDFKNNKLTYAAANNPVWIVREGELMEFASDKMPVGKHDRDTVPFAQETILVDKGDVVYALTDGLPDQFGGPKGKKFMYKQLKELLIKIAGQPMSQQRDILRAVLNEWKGDLEQVDDICLIGVRI